MISVRTQNCINSETNKEKTTVETVIYSNSRQRSDISNISVLSPQGPGSDADQSGLTTHDLHT